MLYITHNYKKLTMCQVGTDPILFADDSGNRNKDYIPEIEDLYEFEAIIYDKNPRTNYYPVITSLTDTINEHYGLFEWDKISNNRMLEILKYGALSGHLYKTLNGFHFYDDNIYKAEDYYNLAVELNTCRGHRENGRIRGYWGLRCGLKQGRLADITYLGHTTNQPVSSSPLCTERDIVYDFELGRLRDNMKIPHPLVVPVCCEYKPDEKEVQRLIDAAEYDDEGNAYDIV